MRKTRRRALLRRKAPALSYIHATVDEGTLRGIDDGRVASFLGVPYGASTAGPNRFRPPQPADRWEGVRDAFTFGHPAPQPELRSGAGLARAAAMVSLLAPRAGSPTEGDAFDEDCLRLNIWAPSGRQGDSLPVLVWFHGGVFLHGSGNQMAFNGDVLAAAGELVVVTVTHRLGLLGFLDLRELGEPGSANAGALDLVAALEWVQRNIAAFGGDPARVTICGQSGGSAKVSVLNAMPRARDLFARSIMMSGPWGRHQTTETAASLRARVMEIPGHSSIEELRAASIDQLLDAQNTVLRGLPRPSDNDDPSRFELDLRPGFRPTHDPDVLPVDTFGDEATDGIRGKELLIGWTSHDETLHLVSDPAYRADLPADDAAARVDALAGLDGVTYPDLVEQFPHEPPHLLLARRLSWLTWQKPARRIAALAVPEAGGVWVYEFQQPTEVLGELLGATHSLEIAYVFGTVDRIPITGRSLDRHAVSRSMMRAWASFARDGHPGWEPWSTTTPVHGFGTPYGPDLRLPDSVDMSAPLTMTQSAFAG